VRDSPIVFLKRLLHSKTSQSSFSEQHVKHDDVAVALALGASEPLGGDCCL